MLLSFLLYILLHSCHLLPLYFCPSFSSPHCLFSLRIQNIITTVHKIFLTLLHASSPQSHRICPPLRSTSQTLTYPTKQHMGKRNVLILSIHHNVRMMTANQSLTNPSSQVARCKVHQRYVGESETLSMMGKFALICEAVYSSITNVIVRTKKSYKNFTSIDKSRPLSSLPSTSISFITVKYQSCSPN
jgi:hypothetical protein